MPLPIAEAYFIAIGLEVLLHEDVHRSLASINVSFAFKRKKTKVIVAMTVVNSVMWAVATSHMAIRFQQNFNAFLHLHAADNPKAFEDNSAPNIYLQIFLESVNAHPDRGRNRYMESLDVMEPKKVSVKAFIVSTLSHSLANPVAAIGLVRVYTMAPPGITLFDNPALSFWLITNIWATSLVAYRTWSHNKFIRSVTRETFVTRVRRQKWHSRHSNRIRHLLLLYMAIVAFACGNNLIYIVIDVLSQLTAIYPTLIITMVCLRSTLDVAIERFQQTTDEWAVRAGGEGNHGGIVTTTSYPLGDLRLGGRMTAHSSGLDQSDSTSGVEGSMNTHEPPREPSDGGLESILRIDDKMDIV
ncbi:hypothetical protein ARMSODRAFT_1016589 [Armillaria solidipes]|uniref:Uncharacterized protein n=1 Tax=Armillaria solidipes TaxID=1076256 RepID=A0A2H3BL22_9AGAR|nr:hypothetical protein ARMSODRAFT_1016589 [Armillaria solidipes]